MGNNNSNQTEDLELYKKNTGLTIPLLEDLQRKFQKLANEDGFIHRSALKQMIKDVYNTENSVLVSAIFNLYDRKNVKKIDFEDFAAGTSLLMKPNVEEILDITFKSYDLNNDGQITRGELKEVFLTKAKIEKQRILGNEAKDLDNINLDPSEVQNHIDEADRIFHKMDINKEGKISKQVFLQVLETYPELKKSINNFLLGYFGKEPQTKIKMLTLRHKQNKRKEVPYDKEIFAYVTSEKAEKQPVRRNTISTVGRQKPAAVKNGIKDDNLFTISGGETNSKSTPATPTADSNSSLTVEQEIIKDNIKNDLKDLDNIVSNLQAVVNDKNK